MEGMDTKMSLDIRMVLNWDVGLEELEFPDTDLGAETTAPYINIWGFIPLLCRTESDISKPPAPTPEDTAYS